MTQNKNFPIAFVCDDNYAVPSIVAITSIIVNRNENTNFKFYILSNGLSEKNKGYFYSFEREYSGVKVEIIDLDATKYESIYTAYEGNTGAGSITALCKFDIPLLIEEDIVLYLDCDIIVKKDISEIFSLNLDDKLAAAVLDSGRIYNTSGLRGQLPEYFNSGVMLLNLKLMREMNITDKLIETRKSYQDVKLVDQDVFNLVFAERILLLPIKYNALMINLNNSVSNFDIKQLNKFYGANYSCLYDLDDDVNILHFASKEKPWLYDDVRFAGLWLKYYKISPCLEKLTRTHYNNNYVCRETQTVPVILATDENYAPQTLVTIISVLENASANDNYIFYILTPDQFSKNTLIYLDSIIKKYGNANVECIKMKDTFKDAKLNIAHITTPTFYRLNAPSLFPQYDKVIYLDSDVVVEGDLAEYYSIDIEGFYVAGVKAASYHLARNGNETYCRNNGLPAIDQYINAGVILLNLKELRDNNIEDEFLLRATKGYRSQDQDVINGACYGHIKHLEYKYNCMVAKYEYQFDDLQKIFSIKELNEANNRPLIIHYAAEEKPWKSFKCSLADRWWKYAQLAPFFDSFLLNSYQLFIDEGKNQRFSLWKRMPSKLSKPSKRSKEFEYYHTARIDIKLFNETADFELETISDVNAKVTIPEWFQKNGKGYQIETRQEGLDVSFIVKTDGKLTVYLRGKDVRDADGIKRLPYWINYNMLTYNGITEFKEAKYAWHDKPITISHQVKAGETVNLHIEWLPCKVEDPELPKRLEVRLQDTEKKLQMAEDKLKDTEHKRQITKDKLKDTEHKRQITEDKLKNTEYKRQMTENKNKATSQKLKASLSREASLKNSVSFRTGRAITWFPRKVRGGVRCLKDHGPAYTVKRLFWHITH